MRTQILGTGSYLPQKIVTNDELSKFLDTSDEWITTRTGIKERRIADKKIGECCSQMGFEAAKNAIENSKCDKNEIDLILCATVTADYRLPSNACVIQENLGLKNVPAFDLAAACAGSIYGLSVANSFISGGKYKRVLLITSELMSAVVNWQDRNTAVLFGDGASAAILGPTNDDSKGFIDIDIYADGFQKELIWVPAGGTMQEITEECKEKGQDKVNMNGRETFKFAVRSLCQSIEKICEKNQIDKGEIDFVVPHQANLRIIDAIAQRMNIPLDRFLINLDKCANTSAASLLLAYDEAQREGRFKPNQKILMLAIGGGFAWGAAIYNT